jgi:hypothetical protein
MRALILAVILTQALSSCRDNEVTGSVNQCATKLYSSYNPKNFDQCVNACIKCENGVMTTCATSCRLKGAQ